MAVDATVIWRITDVSNTRDDMSNARNDVSNDRHLADHRRE